MGAGPPDVVLITLDTTRADRLPPHPQQVAAPAFQWLASEGTVFENAVAAVPLTLPSHASLMTGRRPSHHGVRDNASPALAAAEWTLAEALRGRGFHTAAFVSSMVLQADRGLAQGFDTYIDLPESPCGERVRRCPANRTADAAIEWLREPKDAPLFAWIHLFDAHQPYEIDGD